MKIAHYPGTFLPTIGGVELIVHNLAENQASKENFVFILTKSTSKKYILDNKLNQNYNIGSPIKYSFGVSKLINRVFSSINPIINAQVEYLQRKFNFDIWHFNYITINSYVIIEKLNQMKVPTIATYRGADIQLNTEFQYGKRLVSSFDNLVKNKINNCSLLTATSKSVIDEYKKLGVDDKKIKLIPNFVNLEKFKNSSFNKNDFKKMYNLPPEKKIILTVGRNHPKKGYDLIPYIIKELLIYRKDFIWLLIGSDCEIILKEAKLLGIERYIKNIGELGKGDNLLDIPSKRLINYYKTADIFCFPTRLETFGNVFLEAMASNLPIVTTNAPGARDNVFHNKNGLVVDIDNIKGFVQAINQLLNNKTMADKFILNGMNQVASYNLDKVSSDYLNTYKEVIDNGKY